MTRVTIDVAQKKLPDLIEDIALGNSVVITRDMIPIAQLVPISKKTATPIFGSARGEMKMSADFEAPIDDFDKYLS